jgi:ATP-binding cassette subfamily B protein
VPVFFWLTKMVGERRRQVARSTQESLAAMSALSEETLSVSGVLLAKVFGNQARDTARYHEENQRLADLEVRQQMIGQGFYAIVQSFLSITPAAVYLVTGLLLANGNGISAGTVVAFTTLQTRLYFPIGQLLQVSVELRSSLALFDRVFEYLDVVPDIVDAPTPSICRRSAVAAGWRSGRSISATPARPWTRLRASPSKPTLASSWRWSGRAGPARPPSAT